ncbi:MAG: bifunctional metallophosphatase/5'-nucleotidase [bacterium]|nr:bifunctional metallophosphatase/5'-nucleotidase [bacterium]
MKKLFKYITIFGLLLLVGGCKSKKINDKDIVILNTTDVHCGYEKDEKNNRLGYTSVVSYKKQLEKENYVSVVDCGDAIQGDLIGAISKGKYVIDIMNYIGYDAMTLGNHEFSYGMDELKQRISEFNGDVLSCNFKYTGSGENKFSEVKPYTIKKFGKFKVGYVGITTPETLTSSNPTFFKENNEVVYSFSHETTNAYYHCIQDNINKCKKAGADYVILVSHTGTKMENAPYNTYNILENTTGYVAILDGHAHNDLSWSVRRDKNNKNVYLCDCGYKLNEFASLRITKNGEIETEYITDYTEEDADFNNFLTTIKTDIDTLKNRVLTTIDLDLSIYDEDNHRLVRSRETAIGNLVADAYRIISKADIGFINGGGIRDNLHKGEVTYGDMMAIHPFGNSIMTKRVLGIDIVNYLEFAARDTQDIYFNGEIMVGENGAFANVSGLKYTIDTSITSSVKLDENGNYMYVSGPRRVKDVKVLQDGAYVDIDNDKAYTVASIDYILEDGGDGVNMFMTYDTIPNVEKLDYEVVIEYIVNILHGELADVYSSTEGRITIE